MARQASIGSKKDDDKKKEPSPIASELWGLAIALVVSLAAIGLFTDRAGVVGSMIGSFLAAALGRAAIWWLAGFFALGIAGIFVGGKALNRMRIIGVFLLGLVIAGWYHVGFAYDVAFIAGRQGFGGGLVGAAIAVGLSRAVGPIGRGFVLVAAVMTALLLTSQIPLRILFARALVPVPALLRRALTWIKHLKPERPIPVTPEAKETAKQPALKKEPPAKTTEQRATAYAVPGSLADDAVEVPGVTLEQMSLDAGDYELPPLTLLNMPPEMPLQSYRDVQERGRILAQTLASFGVRARVIGASCGPAVTRYELQLAPGVKVSKVVSLANDLALGLATPDVRIEAPIPGKAAVGVEVPNTTVGLVGLRELLESDAYAECSARLALAIGRDVTGQPVVYGLEQLLHLLIAGATGTGKSVCLNAIIMSLLFRTRPTELRLLLIDPKVVELSQYNGIPHLLSPVVTDPKKAAGCLRWAVVEMERRYRLFAEVQVRDIAGYNEARLRRDDGGEYLPYLVIVLDELADLMAVASRDVEDAIQRLAQMARAAGIHLVIATQRPSVDVITGVIKANIPSRIAFTVASAVDSRTILDSSGADKLVGRGDMLCLPQGANKPIRVQGAFVSEREIERVVTHWKDQGNPSYTNVSAPTSDEEKLDSSDHDELISKAAMLVVEYGQASASLLQRRLRVGYARAGRLIDQLEQLGVVGPHEGSKPRQVKIGRSECEQMFGPSMVDLDQ